MRTQLLEMVTPTFREVFSEPDLILTEQTTAVDVAGWDSFAHVNLIVALEERFAVTFSTRELAAMQSVADLLTLLERKGVVA
jgi:acyl carrier protein